jgi:hypothetical protein
MSNIVDAFFISAIVINTLISFKKPEYGVASYLVLSFICPHLRFLGPAIPYEIAAFLPVVFACSYVSKFKFRFRLEYFFFLSYLVFGIFSTCVSVWIHGANVLWIPIAGFIRVLVVLILIREFLSTNTISKLLCVVIFVNMLVALSQVFMEGAIDITYKLYSKEIGGGVLDQYMEEGFIPRATGTLVSPVNLGVISLISFSVSYQRIISGFNSIYDKILLSSSIVTGIVSLSKTSIIGIPIIFITGLGVTLLKFVIRGGVFNIWSLPKITTAFSVVSVLAWWLVSYLKDLGFTIIRYLGFILNPLKSFDTRYGSGSTTLDKTIEVTMDN